MKTISTLCAIFALTIGSTLQAQVSVPVASSPSAPVSTGKVITVDSKNGAMTIFSEQTRGPITFYGLSEATVQTNDGTPATFATIRADMPVTVHYATRDGRLVVSKVSIADPNATAPAVVTAPGTLPTAPLIPTPRATLPLANPALTDGDITTQPGSKARIDNDITTQPGMKARTDNDITTQPGSKALTDHDITTQPGSKARTDKDITTQPGSKAATDNDITTKADGRATGNGSVGRSNSPAPR